MMNRANCSDWHRENLLMKPFRGVYFPIFLMILVGLLAPIAKAEVITKENVAKRIAEAKTAADHEALASYFRAQAAEAAAMLKIHQNMKTWYGPVEKFPYDSTWMINHCQNLVRTYRLAQEEYESLAEAHGAVGQRPGWSVAVAEYQIRKKG